MPRRRHAVALSDILLIRRPFPPAQCLDVRIRWNLPRGASARQLRAAASRLERPKDVPVAEFRRVLRIEHFLDDLERFWRAWPSALRFRLLFAIEQGVRAVAAHRVYAHGQGQPQRALQRAARSAKSAARLEKWGREDRARDLANVAVGEERAAHLYAGMMDSRDVFAIMIDQARQDAVAAGLKPPPWSWIARLFQLASYGDYSDDKRLEVYLRRLGRGKVGRAITTPSGARALRAAHRIARKP